MKRLLLIVCACLCLSGTQAAKKPNWTIRPAMTVEEEQRFLYYFYEAQRLFEAEEYDLSFRLIDFCYHLQPNDAMVNQYVGDFFTATEHPELSVHYYERSYQADPANQAILPRLQQAYCQLQRYADALHIQDQIDRYHGYSIYSALMRYRLYIAMRDSKKALKELNRYLEQDPNNLQVLLMRLQVYEAVPTRDKVKKEAYEQVLALDPHNALVLNNFAYFLATHKGDLNRAETMSQQAIQKEPKNPVYLDTYAWILHLKGQHQLARMYMQQALNYMSRDMINQEIYYHYQQILQKP